jgi:arsenate reductase (thioredoxin)
MTRPSSVPFDRAIEGVIARLAEEFAGVFSPGTVERYVRDWLTQPLFRRAQIETYIPIFVERFARDRLRAVAHLEGLMERDKPQVLFVCVHNAGRSQMAAAFTHVLSDGKVEVLSAGSEPAVRVNPVVVEAMAELGIDISHEVPKPLADEVVADADVVITMGCGDACPVYPGKRYLDWELDDPAGQPLPKVRAIRDEIRRRVEGLLADLKVPVQPR